MKGAFSPFSALARQCVPVIHESAGSLNTGHILDFGPVFLPAIRGLEIVRHDDVDRFSSSERTVLAVSSFGLSLLSANELDLLLDSVHAAADFAIIIDFKCAERNIELPATLVMHGIRRLLTDAKKPYAETGGLEALLYAQRSRFQVMERHSLIGGGLACVLTRSLRS